MDFFQFLQNSKNNNDTKSKKTQEKNSKQHKNISKPENKKSESSKPINKDNDNINTNSLYKNIRKGNFVKIVYLPNSPLNAYKGYFGEIKDYKYGQDEAIVFLHSINSLTFVKFPLNHFILID